MSGSVGIVLENVCGDTHTGLRGGGGQTVVHVLVY